MISIIVPSYYSQSTIKECLQSLMNQDIEEKFEIWVVNSSPDDTCAIIQQHFPTVYCIQLEKRAFAGKARNIGI